MRIAICQLNPTVGDLEGNLAKLRKAAEASAKEKPDLLVFSELFLTGYPPRDLLEKPWFVRRAESALKKAAEISKAYPETGFLLGTPLATGQSGWLSNAAVLLFRGKLIGCQGKALLPSYDVFDEARYFAPAEKARPMAFKGERLGATICEDAWNDPKLWPRGRRYRRDPVAELAGQGATVLVNLAASPFEAGKDRIRFSLMASHARRHGLPVIMANQVGGNDELVFDGRSIAVDSKGRLAAHLASFAEEIRVFDTRNTGILRYRALDEVESIHRALVLGVRDYFAKCGFHQAVLGLSGGIDSALVACIAAEALGPENVLGITMPSPYSSRGSFQDSETLAKNLGISFSAIPIADIYQAYRKNLEPSLGGGRTGSAPDVAWENVQARIRGNILMAFSNKMGYMVLSTGNKSELAVGYCTLYGDMSGGLAVISDVPKTMVYKLAGHVNRRKAVIPKSIIQKAPSAELRPNQRDQDTLPPYPVLDAILELYIEEKLDPSAIVKRGYKRSVVDWVVRAVKASEYKRRQAAPGLKVTGKAFGSGRRMPVATKY
jgi:NAD+ synthase (glutamine-hydrolysing)